MKKKILFFIFSMLFSQLSIYYVNYRERNNSDIQLKDPIVDNLPYFKGLDNLYDLMSFPPTFLSLIYLDKLPLENLMVNVGLIYLLRALCILTTTIPKFKTCQIKHNDIKSFFVGGCYDKIFSGHVAFMTTFILYLVSYTEQNKYKFIYYLYILIGSFLSLITESHYSIDVLVSWIISVSIFIIINKNLNYEVLI